MNINNNQNIMPYLYEGVYVVNQKRKIIFWNDGSERITGYSAKEVVHSFCYQNILQHIDETGKQLCLGGCPLQKTLDDGIINESKVYLKHKDGYRIPVMVKTLPIYDEKQNIVAAIEVFTDERFQKQVYRENIELKNRLKIDTLTQIANRNYCDFQLEKRLEESKAFSNTFGLLLIDIDLFKNVNDTYGHLIGDEVLKVVAKTLASNIKRTDLVSRWGGEEFVVLVNVANLKELKIVAEKLRTVVSASSYKMENNKHIKVTISIGGTLAQPEDTIKSIISKMR
ncbi:diguanylate cyclase [Mycoplasmatota bacterium]|nr:diguanylate cyclase [Mycoplasmatota bacterium]